MDVTGPLGADVDLLATFEHLSLGRRQQLLQ